MPPSPPDETSSGKGEAASRRAGLLDGIVVLDFTHVLSGPFASMILADMGAMVIKIERPGMGDAFREAPPFFEGISHQFAAVNRGKYGVAIDLRQPEGVRIARDLAAKADIVINNFRPGVMERIGLGAETLRADNPRLIFASVSGYGQTGSMARKPAFDPVIQAMAGLMSLTGEAGGSPMRPGLSWGDLQAGVFAAMAIIGALYDRERTGRGQDVDVAMFDALFFMLSYFVPYYQWSGELPKPQGPFHQTLVPCGTYPTRDGHISLAPVTQEFWRDMCGAIGRPEWIDDPRYATLEARQTHRNALIADLTAVLRAHDTMHWRTIFEAHDFPAAPILNIADLIAHPLVAERGLLADLDLGGASAPIGPFRLSGSDHAVRRPPPHLGGDTHEVLRDLLGLTEERIAALERTGAIAGETRPY